MQRHTRDINQMSAPTTTLTFAVDKTVARKFISVPCAASPLPLSPSLPTTLRPISPPLLWSFIFRGVPRESMANRSCAYVGGRWLAKCQQSARSPLRWPGESVQGSVSHKGRGVRGHLCNSFTHNFASCIGSWSRQRQLRGRLCFIAADLTTTSCCACYCHYLCCCGNLYHDPLSYARTTGGSFSYTATNSVDVGNTLMSLMFKV